ncbi:MAG: hypothetical protein AB1491_07585 [Thermodesulfobacteriota bacterium]
MQKKYFFGLLVGMGLICLASVALAFASFLGPPPYTGIIINKSSKDVSFPSQDSGAALIVPAGGNLEYIAWSREFNLLGYVADQPYFCRKIKIGNVKFPYHCKHYDFLAEIKSDRPAPSRQPLRKKPRVKRKPPKC